MLYSHINDLVNHNLGNYAVQVCIDVRSLIKNQRFKSEFAHLIFPKLLGNLTDYSMEKYSSNVIEKCLDVDDSNANSNANLNSNSNSNSKNEKDSLVTKYILEITGNNSTLDVMKNMYGNFVIQKALKYSDKKHKQILIDHILKSIDRMGDKKIEDKWREIVTKVREGKYFSYKLSKNPDSKKEKDRDGGYFNLYFNSSDSDKNSKHHHVQDSFSFATSNLPKNDSSANQKYSAKRKSNYYDQDHEGKLIINNYIIDSLEDVDEIKDQLKGVFLYDPDNIIKK